jgi:hypothetical protein
LDAASNTSLGWRVQLSDRAGVRYVLVLVAACGAATPHNGGAPTAGSIAGLARDHDSGDPVAKANIHVRAVGHMAPLTTITSADGVFGVDHLAHPARTLTARLRQRASTSRTSRSSAARRRSST